LFSELLAAAAAFSVVVVKSSRRLGVEVVIKDMKPLVEGVTAKDANPTPDSAEKIGVMESLAVGCVASMDMLPVESNTLIMGVSSLSSNDDVVVAKFGKGMKGVCGNPVSITGEVMGVVLKGVVVASKGVNPARVVGGNKSDEVVGEARVMKSESLED